MNLSRREILVAVAAAPLLMAETTTLLVRVTDPTGARIADAQVTFLAPDGKQSETSRSDAKGEVKYSGSPIHRILVFTPGFGALDLFMSQANGSVLNARFGFSAMPEESLGGLPLPARTGRIPARITDNAGVPLAKAHGWTGADGKGKAISANAGGEILFTSVRPGYVGMVIVADGFPSKVVGVEVPGADEVSVAVKLG